MTTIPSAKVWCSVCECMINPLGHSERCRLPNASSEVTQFIKRVSWIGDVSHRLDIRCAAVLAGVPQSSVGAFEEQFVSNVSMKSYMLMLYPDKQGSASTMGTLFESKYYGEFRQNYLLHLFPATANKIMEICSELDFAALFGQEWVEVNE